MEIKVLIDNITKSDLFSEWGLSFSIDYQGHKLLLDTGASGKFSENAAMLGIDLDKIEAVVISHAHYDHTNGLESIFAYNTSAKVFLQKTAAENCYAKKWLFRKYVGIKRGILHKYESRIRFAEGDFELLPGAFLIPHKGKDLSSAGKKAGLYLKTGRKLIPDSFEHEQSLVFHTPKGLVICNSCSHGGVTQIISEVMKTFPQIPVYAMIGGFHLYETRESEIYELAEQIQKLNIQKIYTGHCTGGRAFKILREVLGTKIEQMYTGMEIKV